MKRKDHIIKICKLCGKEFLVQPYKAETSNFCCKQCYFDFKSKDKVERKCQLCGEIFFVSPSRANTANFCSRKCYVEFDHNQRVKKICETCGNEFYVKQSYDIHGGGKYCSKKCMGEGKRGINSPHYKDKIKKICEMCGNEFLMYPSEQINGRKFCSRECFTNHLSIIFSGSGNPMFGKPSVNKGVPMIEETKQKLSESHKGKQLSIETRLKISNATRGENNPFYGKHHEEGFGVGDKNSRFGVKVSTDTIKKMSESHIGQMRENKNPNWKGGITPLRKAIRECREMYEWKQKVFDRDDYRDWYSGLRGGNLEVHHIIKFEDLLRKYNINTLDDARNCKELWDVNNGITMRIDIHKAHHDIWGR